MTNITKYLSLFLITLFYITSPSVVLGEDSSTTTTTTTTSKPKKLRKSQIANDPAVKCEVCTKTMDFMATTDVYTYLNSQLQQEEKIHRGVMSRFDAKIDSTEAIQNIVDKSCEAPLIKVNSTLAYACNIFLEDTSVETASFFSEWIKTDIPRNFRSSITQISRLSTPAMERKPITDRSLDNISRHKVTILLAKLRHDMVSKNCVFNLEVCPPLPPFNPHNVPIEDTIKEKHTQKPPTPVFPNVISNGKPHMITAETLYPFISGKPLDVRSLSSYPYEENDSVDHPYFPTLTITPNTHDQDVIVFYTFPKTTKCYEESFASKDSIAVDCKYPPSPDDGVLHNTLFPLLMQLAKLSKGFDTLSIGILNGRMNTMEEALSALQGKPALFLHSPKDRLKPFVLAEFDNYVPSFENILSFLGTRGSEKTNRWASMVAAGFEQLGYQDYYFEKIQPEAVNTKKYKKMIQNIAKFVQKQKDFIATGKLLEEETTTTTTPTSATEGVSKDEL